MFNKNNYLNLLLNLLKYNIKFKLNNNMNDYVKNLDDFYNQNRIYNIILNKHKFLFNITLKTTFNNSFITITDYKGKIILRTMPGKWRFKGSERRTHTAIKLISEIICFELVNDLKIKNIIFNKNGIDLYKKYMILLNNLLKFKVKIYKIMDKTTIAHNGTRLKKKWRLKNKKRRRLIR